MRFEDFIAELEAEAQAEGPAAVAELEAFRHAFAAARRRHRTSSLVARLACVIRPAHILGWLNTPIPALDGDTPIERIATGDHESVARLISSLEDPGAS
jgi:hypothetical protein